MLPVNALLAWAWVGGHLGLPALGAVGAAYATATVSWAGAAAMLALIWLLPRAGERAGARLSAAALAARAARRAAARLVRAGAGDRRRRWSWPASPG